MMTCKFCGSEKIVIHNCRCGIPCIIECKVCGKRDYDTLPHIKQGPRG